jgi:cytochrome c5
MRAVFGAAVVVATMTIGGVALAQDAKVAEGVKLYAANKCAMCHAIEGKGNKKFPLDGVGTKLTADQIKEWLVDPKSAAAKAKSEAKPPMTSYAKLSAGEIEAIVAYMVSLKK